MSCKSLLYTTLLTTTTVDAGGLIPISAITRRIGTSMRVDGAVVTLLDPGYYMIAVNANVQPEAAEAITMTILENGVPLAGAVTTAEPAAIADNTSMQIPAAIVRVYCKASTTIAVRLSADAAVTSAALTIIKV